MYIISYDVAAIAIAIVLLIAHSFLFNNSDPSIKACRLFNIALILEAVLDILSAKNMDGSLIYPDNISVLILTLYYVMEHTSIYLVCRLMAIKMNHKGQGLTIYNNVILFIGYFMYILNIYWRYAFNFTDGVYEPTPAYISLSIISYFYSFSIIYVFFAHRKELTLREKLCPYMFFISIWISYVIQESHPQFLLLIITKVFILILYYSLFETPEHQRLVSVVEDLKEAQREQLEAIEQVENSDKKKNDFLVKMSHEMRTPINAFLGFNETIQRECSDEQILKLSNNMIIDGNELLDLTNSIYDFSQLNVGSIEKVDKEYRIEAVYSLIYRRIHNLLDSNNVDIQIDNHIDENLPKILYGDYNRLCQIYELITKFIISKSKKGVINIYIKLYGIEKNKVNLNFEMSYLSFDYIRNLFANEPEQDIDFIFLCELVEALNSKLEYVYENGVNKFTFNMIQEIVDMMPIGRLKEKVLNSESLESNCQGPCFIMPNANILVVDDMHINLKVFEAIIAPFKAKVTTAKSGERALKLMEENIYDIVFLDILMPEMDGVETLKQIRERTTILNNSMPVVALTANVFMGARDKYLSDGFAEYITKPINSETVENILRTLMPEYIQEDWEELDVTSYSETTNVDMLKDYDESKDDFSAENFADKLFNLFDKDSTAEDKLKDDLFNLINDNSNAESFLNNDSDEGLIFLAEEEKKIEEDGTPDVNGLADIPGLSILDGLNMCMGNMELYIEVLHDYCKEADAINLKDFYDKENWNDYRILIHGLKSISKTVGINSLFDGAKDLEKAARALDIDFIHAHHDDWYREYTNITSMIRNVLSKL